MSGKTYYDVLGVAANATAEDIRQAYLVRMKVMHPDRFDQARQTKEWEMANKLLEELNGAYATLRDPLQRRHYDQKIGRASLATASAGTAKHTANTVGSTARSYTSPQSGYTTKPNWQAGASAQQTKPQAASPYQSRSETTARPSEPPPRRAATLFAALFLVGLVALFGVAINASRLHMNFSAFALPPTPSAPAPASAPVPAAPDYDEQAFPENGTIYGYAASANADLANQARPGIALFTVHTVSDDKFFVKMVNAATNQPVLGFCASPNATVTVKVPLGSYYIRYATGKTWYGIAHLFGPNTQYCRLNRKVDFLPSGAGTPMNTITLYSSAEDNHVVTPITDSDF